MKKKKFIKIVLISAATYIILGIIYTLINGVSLIDPFAKSTILFWPIFLLAYLFVFVVTASPVVLLIFPVIITAYLINKHKNKKT